jgi:hypothetical protein
MQAVGLAELFRYHFGQVRITAPVPYRVELSAPEGPSTGGGKQSVQHLKLVPERGGTTIVIGSADPVERSGELRSWNRLYEIHAQRFKGRRLPLDAAQYGHLLGQLKQFFASQSLPVVMVDSAPRDAAAPARTGVSPLWIVIALVLAGVVVYLATR